MMSQAKNDGRILVQCDFDGTITEKDVSFMLLDAFADGDWRAVNKQYNDGEITVGQFNQKAFDMVGAGKESMLDYIKNRVKLRRGFKTFVKQCREKGMRLVIISNGLDFYIKSILEDNGLQDIEFHAAETGFNADGLKVQYVGPDGNVVDSEYKEKYVGNYLSEGYQVVYIGNGASDFPPARNCHKIFATESLLRHCNLNGLPCIPFTSFIQINRAIKSW